MSKKNKGAGDPDDVIIIRLWPKTPILYPMAFMALLCGIAGLIFGTPQQLAGEVTDETPAAGKPAAVEEIAPEEESEEPPVETPATDPTPEEAQPEEVKTLAVGEEKEAKTKDRGSLSSNVNTIMALLFLAAFSFSLFVVCIDFEVRWSMLGFILVLLVVLGVFAADHMEVIKLPSAISMVSKFTLFATPLFYFSIFVIWLVLMLVSAVIARLHFVKIEHNEVIEYGGVMESQKRMSTMRMHWTKEITDVCEYWLPFVRSGTLVFNFPNEEKPLILNNVLHINKVLKKLDKKSSSFQFKGE